MITAKTEFGILEGKKKGEETLFLGIPYAEPPTGEYRFRAATDPKPWDGIRSAKKNGPACLQLGADPSPSSVPLSGTSEDCLYLNIRTPAPLIRSEEQDGDQFVDTEAGLPVYVFVHGGAFEMGGCNVPLYDGRSFSDKGIVYVSINYRLGVFGAMCLETLREESEQGWTGCYSASDVLKALEWIHRNIRSFGGDPDRVTLGGESAGAFLVSIMLHTHAAGRYFQRCILESGTARGCAVKAKYGAGNYDILLEGSRAVADSFGAGDDPEGLKILRSLPAEELVSRWFFHPDGTARGLFSDPAFGMFLYGYDRLPDPSEISAPVDLFFGFNTDEGTMFAKKDATEEDYGSLIRHHYPVHAEEILARYPVDGKHSPFDRMAEIIGLGAFSGSMLPYADQLTANGGRVFGYHFDYLTERLREEGLGVRHIVELHFVFHRFLRAAGAEDENGEQLSLAMNRAWVSFIKNGDPGLVTMGDQSLKWPQYKSDSRQALRFGNTVTSGSFARLEDLLYLERLLTAEYGDNRQQKSNSSAVD